MMNKISLALFLTFLSSLIYAQPPQLIVQIVVDQLRGDLLNQYHNEFGKDGFNYLLRHSLNFSNAHHAHANTTTCVGHATISTGSYPALHGIIDNEWFQRSTKKIVYCMKIMLLLFCQRYILIRMLPDVLPIT